MLVNGRIRVSAVVSLRSDWVAARGEVIAAGEVGQVEEPGLVLVRVRFRGATCWVAPEALQLLANGPEATHV